MKIDKNTNALVSYSRAGDVFHYRWAARRCLRLIQPTSNLELVVIEGSKERKKAGEYVIDVSEYYNGGDSKKRIEYYQLKHTTVRNDQPFTLSRLKGTITGFSNRYQQHVRGKSLSGVSFTIITNRKIDTTFKAEIEAIVKGDKVNKKFIDTLKKYTNLNEKELIRFCRLLNFEDGEGDYNVQKEDLKIEIARLQPGSIDPAQVDSIVSLVQEKVLPDSNGEINQEEILKRFGVTNEKQLFPAPQRFTKSDNITIRTQYQTLLDNITTADNPIIIKAEGGAGKSVFSQHALQALPEGSLGIAYDCFGSGTYRSRSKPRHRHRDALVQIANELASKGLCERMIVQSATPESDIMRGFISRIGTSIKALKKAEDSAELVILIDAADNAEMAAQEFGDSCFANELLREEFPSGCKIALLCRPERIHLLRPPSFISQFTLLPFSKEETLENLKKWFPKVKESEGFEFHRLTSGNPRVQMNSIVAGHSSVHKLLAYLGPSGTTVEKQIEQQLNTAVQRIKDALPKDYQNIVNKICTGLASLPPNIPIQVLSQAAEVKIEDVRSFVADIGRSLWMLDSSVQFRDEPTETWFRNTYLGSKGDYNNYISFLEPLAGESVYVAEVLPQLYLLAGQYNQLINIALSDNLLPINNPIDVRNVLVYRLQFAFKAALRLKKYGDAIKLALRAGEEVAGDQRQQNLFLNNIDLLPKLQDKSKVQEIAFKGLLRSGWEGSDNVFTASLLSEIEEFQGEANGYLRSAMNWLSIYFQEQKQEKGPNRERKIQDEDIIGMALSHLNLSGARSCLKFLNSLRPKEAIFRVMAGLIGKLIDAGRFSEINQILRYARKSKYYVVAIVSELEKVGHFAEVDDLVTCLDFLSNKKTRINKPVGQYNEQITPSVVAFLEVCLHRKLDTEKILNTLDYYVPPTASKAVGDNYNSRDRNLFLKALSIRKVISKNLILNLEELIPEAYKSKDKKRGYSDEIREFKEVIGGLFPWFLLRALVISGKTDNLEKRAEQASQDSKHASAGRYRMHDVLPNEIAEVSSSILIYCYEENPKVIQQYYYDYVQNNKSFKISQRLNLLHAGSRTMHLSKIIEELEHSTYELINGLKEARPEDIAGHYISLARAVIYRSKSDAAVYFEEAINVVSKFGDEIVQRWEAIDALGARSATKSSDEIAYRFFRCAELVGNYVYREKHWDRSGALVTCSMMSPQIGISGLSRWRDREIGRFEYQLEALLYHLVSSKIIRPAEGWSFADFLSDYPSNEFLSICLVNEPSEKIRMDILRDAVELLTKEGAIADYWMELKTVADLHQIAIEDLDKVVDFYKDIANEPKTLPKDKYVDIKTEGGVKEWNRVFQDLDFLKPEGFSTLYKRFSDEVIKEGNNLHLRLIDLYKEALNRIDADKVLDFVNVLLGSENINEYDFELALKAIPVAWKNKVSFKKKWPVIINRLGIKFAHRYANRYSFDSAVRELGIDDSLAIELRKGIFEGLSQGQAFVDASVLFGFVEHASKFINAIEASDLTDYALSRFELHIEDNFGDGHWDKWLYVTNDVSKNLAGFIWSALGSPRSQTRWKACHVIKKLADFNCNRVLYSLIDWVEHDKVDAFGSNQFPFYNLHARQYLLIAFERVSIDHPAMLIGYKQIFLKYSQSEPHVLIQHFAAKTALNIERDIPGTYSSKEISYFNAIGKSKKGKVKGQSDYPVDSYLHAKGQIDTTIDYNFAYDFDKYWFEPLGNVFGISGNQIQDLCANVIVKDWKLGTMSGYYNDPRVNLWNQSRERETWYHKSDYPKTDNLDFYLSYHSMLVTAARLVKNMPVIASKNSWDEKGPWDSWLSRHLLTRRDSKWLADCRGSVPLERPIWISQDNYEHWRTDIQDKDFLKSIKVKYENELWLNVKGRWTESHNTRYETYSVSTALVSKETSDALLRALTACSNPHDYKLPDYEEVDIEIDSEAFQLKGLVNDSYSREGIDKFDPYSDNIYYPPFTFGESFIKALDLFPDSEGEILYFSDGGRALKCVTWSSNQKNYDKSPEQSGMRLSASLSLLKKLCQVYDCNLIIEVNISRDIEYQYRPDDYKYLNPNHKIYILSANGKLKSAEKNYQLR